MSKDPSRKLVCRVRVCRSSSEKPIDAKIALTRARGAVEQDVRRVIRHPHLAVRARGPDTAPFAVVGLLRAVQFGDKKTKSRNIYSAGIPAHLFQSHQQAEEQPSALAVRFRERQISANSLLSVPVAAVAAASSSDRSRRHKQQQRKCSGGSSRECFRT